MERFQTICTYILVMKQRICLLLNSLSDYTFSKIISKYLPSNLFDIDVFESFPENPLDYQLIIPWSYRKLIKDAESIGNIVVMHSSNLPEGRGWAPIYYTFKEKKDVYTISGVIANNEIDAGEIVIRASFPIYGNYTATYARKVDEEISLMLIAKIIENWPDGKLVGKEQIGIPSYRSRRTTQDNKVNLTDSLIDILPHLRGVEDNSPAFFVLDGHKYFIKIYPESEPPLPKQIKIEYPALNKIEIWTS